ncbi:FecR family protein [Pseudobacter ginsenosidimutans]|uniref:FecR family protein n=1 Tax=Pseudobacter ginsenosidimutans TaxID=661488 RepID=A0A4Q7MYM1_9BACT|nr:FecR family protein [Pseudobacter ginsenosidimutans]
MSDQEWQELKTLATEENHEVFTSVLEAQLHQTTEKLAEDEVSWEFEIRQIVAVDQVSRKVASIPRIAYLRRWWVAASVVLLLTAGYFFWWSAAERKSGSLPVVAKNNDVAPGKQGAMLTLHNGAVVLLDTMKNGIVALQDGAVARVENGILRYEGNAGREVYNTMSTPKGRQFQVILPDGSNVWLNAASSIRYPASFTGKERKVEISGEAYFEVTSNPQMPFRVVIDHQAEVEVLGTAFNINAYLDDKRINTTLLEGSIKVSRLTNTGKDRQAASGVILKQGQEVQIGQDQQSAPQIIDKADIEKVMAWKNGLFNFNDMPLPTVMNQLARWYDIDIKYEGEIPDRIFAGEITRDLSLSQLLLLFKDIGIRYEIKGRTLIIKP